MMFKSFFTKKQLMSSVALVCISPMLLGTNSWNKDDTKQMCLYAGLGLMAYKIITYSMEEKTKQKKCDVTIEDIKLKNEAQKGLNTKLDIERLKMKAKLITFKTEQEINRSNIEKDRIIFIENQTEQFCSQEDEELCEAFRKNLLKNIEHFQNSSITQG